MSSIHKNTILSKGDKKMKALYSNEKEIQGQTISEKELKTYDYDSRYEALKQGFNFVHLFETVINSLEKKEYKYYSTMKL